MSTDGDLSKGSGTDEGPDEFDSVVLDENFIRGGVSEASLRRYQVVSEQKWVRPPSSRPTGQRPATNGRPSDGGSTSSNSVPSTGPDGSGRQASGQDASGQDGPGTERPGKGPTGRGPGPHLGTGESFSSSGFEHRRPRSTGLLVGAAALVVALVVLTGLIRLGRGSAGSAGTGNLPVAAQAGPGAGQTVSLSPSVPAGSCFNLPADSTAANMTVSVVGCAVRHQYELVDLQQGTGTNDQYPTQATWNTDAYNQCSDDMQTYTGEASAKWPVGLYPAIIPPTKDNWAKGDRTIYCIAGLQSAATGSVRGLGSGFTPTG